VYALGVVFYELLCDKLPYDVRGLPIHQATRVIREQTPTSTRALDKTLRGDIETIAFKALEKERSRRYQSAAEFGQDIQRYLDHQPIQARRPSVLYQVRIFARRNKAAFSAIAATFFILVAGVIVSTSMYFRAERARAEQSRERQRAEGARNEAQAVTTFLSDMLAQADPWKSGKDILVRQVLDEASKTIATKFADEPLAEAQLRGALGNAYFGLGLHPQAEPHLRATLEIRERELGKSHVDAIRSMNDLTRLYYSQGRIDECEALNSAAIDAARETLGEEDVLTLTALQLRANVLREKRRSQEALTLGRRVWEVRRRVLGEEHIETLKTAYNIALYYIGLGQKAEGIALLEHTLASLRRTVGEAHPMTLGTADVLADMYWGEGRIEEAVAILERTWRSQIDILGSDHPDTVRTMWRLPGAYLDLGRRAEAAQLQQRLLPHLRWQAEREGATASDLNRCAWLLLTALDQALHDPPRARSFAERACLLERQRGGNGVWDYARTLALARFRMGEPNAAMETAVQVLFPLEGDDAGEQLNDYASVLLTDDNLKGVDPTGRTALAVAERACALDQDGGESRGLHLDTLALAQHRTGNTAKAIETQKKALSMLAPEDYHRRDMEKRLAEFEAVLSARVPDASSP
jgi:hypothetical protein